MGVLARVSWSTGRFTGIDFVMLEKLRICWTIPELRRKILLTLGLLAIYRIGWQITMPFVDQEQLAKLLET